MRALSAERRSASTDLAGRLLALASGDGVADGAGQRLVVEPALDEVVLGAVAARRRTPPTGPPTWSGRRPRPRRDGPPRRGARRAGRGARRTEVDEHAVGTLGRVGQALRRASGTRRARTRPRPARGARARGRRPLGRRRPGRCGAPPPSAPPAGHPGASVGRPA